MDREFRKSTFRHLLKQAGIVSDLVEKSFSTTSNTYHTLGSVGAGTSIMTPNNPVKSDGSVDIIFQIRGIPGGDTKTASSLGSNAVIISCEKGGKGSKENLEAYGSPSFINQAVNNILANLKQKFPDKNIHLGKLTISSFSGGGSATAALLMNRGALPKGTVAPKFVFIDGLHADPKSNVMKAVVDYAKEVKDNPKAGELSIVHTAVVPGSYASTTQVADHILDQVGAQRQSTNRKQGEGSEVHPTSESQAGGLKVIQLYDTKQPYMVKDPSTGQMKPNIPGTAGWQHMQALSWSLKNAI
jgi:hypothetical protein